MFTQQVEKSKQAEGILVNRITQLEEKQSEDDVTLCGINRYWSIFDENCRLFAKQFNVDDDDVALFDKREYIGGLISSRIFGSLRLIHVIFQYPNSLYFGFVDESKFWKTLRMKGGVFETRVMEMSESYVPRNANFIKPFSFAESQMSYKHCRAVFHQSKVFSRERDMLASSVQSGTLALYRSRTSSRFSLIVGRRSPFT